MTDGGGESGRRPVLGGRQGVGRTGARLPRRTEAAPPADEAPPALPPGPSSTASDPLPAPWPDRTPAGGGAGDPLVGRTGARFDSRGRRLRRRPKREAAEDSVVQAQAVPVRQRVELGRGGTVPTPRASWSDAWWAGARWSEARPSDARPPEVRPSEVRPSEFRWSDDEAPTAPLHLAELRSRVEGIEPRVSVRPYVRTRGRTHARSDLRLETLVSIPSPRRPMDDPEHRAIGELCDGPRSVAEVAALMGMPLGVARILIGDMADEGTLTVHRTLDRLGPGSGPDRAVMARVLRGLRAL
ncbi:MAG: hypothetical protein QOE59_106 [Actinomycetota bacterium]|nr:hypothetical protein [Actinomycetota bacterium]